MAQVNTNQPYQSIMLQKNDGDQVHSIKRYRIIKAKTSSASPLSFKGKFNIVDSDQIEIQGNTLKLDDISSISVPSKPAQIAGGVLIAAGVIAIIVADSSIKQSTGIGNIADIGSAAQIGFGLGTTGVGIALLFVKKKYDIQNDWSLSIQ